MDTGRACGDRGVHRAAAAVALAFAATTAGAAWRYNGKGETSDWSDQGNWTKSGGYVYFSSGGNYINTGSTWTNIVTVSAATNINTSIELNRGLEDDPFVIDNKATLDFVNLTLCARLLDRSDRPTDMDKGWGRLVGGVFNGSGGVYVGDGSDSTLPGELDMRDTTLNIAGPVNLRSGRIVSGVGSTVNLTSLETGMSVGCLTNASAAACAESFVLNDGGTWFGGDQNNSGTRLLVGTADGAVAAITNASGTITWRNYVCVGNGGNDNVVDATLAVTGGAVTNRYKFLHIGESGAPGSVGRVVVSGDGQYYSRNSIRVGYRTTASLALEDDALVTAISVDMCMTNAEDWTEGETCSLLLDGGVLNVGYISYGGGGAPSYVAFNGGTLRARPSDISAKDPLLPANGNLEVSVGENGGTIDNDGASVVVEADLLGAGCMTFAGTGRTTIAGDQTGAGLILCAEGDTCLAAGIDVARPVSVADGATLSVTGGAAPATVGSIVFCEGSSLNLDDPSLDSAALSCGEITFPDEGAVVLKCNGGEFANGYYRVLVGDVVTLEAAAEKLVPAVASGTTWEYVRRGGVLVLAVGVSLSGDGFVWTGMAGDGRMSSPGNWLCNDVPGPGDTLDFSYVSAATTVIADIHDAGGVPVEFNTFVMGRGVVTINGSAAVAVLTNAHTLSVAQGATLGVSGDVVVYFGEGEPVADKVFLHSNYGTVSVGGAMLAYCRLGGSDGEYPNVHLYAVSDSATKPVRAHMVGINNKNPGQLYFSLDSLDNKPGDWVVGADGLAFPSSREAKYSRFAVSAAGTTLRSSANWTLANTDKANTSYGDLCVFSPGPLVIDTSDYDNPALGHTVTFDGRLWCRAGGLLVRGTGMLVVNTAPVDRDSALRLTTVNAGQTLAVTESATLKLNAGKKIAGAGTTSLASGTTLSIPGEGAEIAGALVMEGGSKLDVGGVSGDAAPLSVGSLAVAGDGAVEVSVGNVDPLAAGTYRLVACSGDLDSAVASRFSDARIAIENGCIGAFSAVDGTLVYEVRRLGDAVAAIGDAVYPTLQAAVCSGLSTENGRARLLADTSEIVKVSKGSTLYLDENGFSFFGLFEGDGVVNMAAAPAKSGTAAGPLVAGGWTGLFQVAWNPGNAEARVNLNDLGNAGSAVEILGVGGVFAALPADCWGTSGGSAPEIAPAVVLSADWTVGRGWDGVETSFSSLSGSGSLVVNGTFMNEQIVYAVGVLDGFTGTLGGARALYRLGDVRTDEAVVPGAILVKLDATASVDYSRMTVNGETLSVVAIERSGQRGVYVADDVVGVCEVNGTQYMTIGSAIAASSAANPATLLRSYNQTIVVPAGQVLYFSEGGYAFTGTFSGAGEVVMSEAPKKYRYDGVANGATLFADGWTGVFTVGWDVNGGRFVFDDFGTADSVVKVSVEGGFTGVPAGAWVADADGDGAPTVRTELLLNGDWTIGSLDGWDGSTTTLRRVSGWGTVSVEADYACTYNFQTVVGFDFTFASEYATVKIGGFVDLDGFDPEVGDALAYYDEPFLSSLSRLTVNGKPCLYELDGGAIVFLGFSSAAAATDDNGMGGTFDVQPSTLAKLPAGVEDPALKPEGSALSWAQLDALGLLADDGTFEPLRIVSVAFDENGHVVVAANAKASDGYSPVLYLLGKESVEAEWPEVSGAVASGAPGEPLADETAAGAGRIYKVSVRIGN